MKSLKDHKDHLDEVKIILMRVFFFSEVRKYLQDAEKKNDMSFVKKANALKRSRDQTDNEIKTL